MRRSALATLPIFLLLAGCGGSSQSSAPSAERTLQGGVKSLNLALAGGSGRATNLKSAQSAFDAAYARTPDDARVSLGYGLSTAALAANVFADYFGTDPLFRAARPQGNAVAGRLRLLGGLGDRLGSGERTSLATLALGFASLPKTRGVDLSPAAVAADLQRVVDRLTDARIAALETNPLVLSEGGVTIKLGSVEAYALRSAVKAAHGLLDGTVAYGLASGAEGFVAPFATRFAAPIAAGTAIAPTDYLPGGLFGKRQESTAPLLADLGVQWSGAADDGNLALTALAARAGSDWLSDLAPLDDSDKSAIKAQLDLLKAALAGPTAVPYTAPDGSTVGLTVDLAAFIANPPADLRAFFPSLRPVPPPPPSESTPTTLRPVAGSVADPTLGGLVPRGLPDALLYDKSLDVDETTTVGEVAAWAFPLGATE